MTGPCTGTGHFFFKNIKISDPGTGLVTGTGTAKSPGKSPVQSPGHVPGHFQRPVVSRSSPGTVPVMSRYGPGPVPDRYRSSTGPVPFSVTGTEELLYILIFFLKNN